MLKFSNLGLARGMALKFYTSVAKGLKLKARILTFAEVTEEKLVGGRLFGLLPTLNGVKGKFYVQFQYKSASDTRLSFAKSAIL